MKTLVLTDSNKICENRQNSNLVLLLCKKKDEYGFYTALKEI